jgi:hypothetical protein
MCVVVIDFTFLEGRYVEVLFKDLAAVDSHSNRVSLHVYETVQLGGSTDF